MLCYLSILRADSDSDGDSRPPTPARKAERRESDDTRKKEVDKDKREVDRKKAEKVKKMEGNLFKVRSQNNIHQL